MIFDVGTKKGNFMQINYGNIKQSYYGDLDTKKLPRDSQMDCFMWDAYAQRQVDKAIQNFLEDLEKKTRDMEARVKVEIKSLRGKVNKLLTLFSKECDNDEKIKQRKEVYSKIPSEDEFYDLGKVI